MGAFPWARIAAAGYRTRYIEKVLRTYYVDGADSMSKKITVKRPMTNVHRNMETLNLAWKYFGAQPWQFIKAAFNLGRFAQASGLGLKQTLAHLKWRGARFLVGITWPLALFKPVGSGS